MANRKNKKLTLLQKLDQAAQRRKLDRFTSDSYSWYKKKAKTLIKGSALRDKLIKDQTSRGMALERGPAIGNMYTYFYDAKHKDTLPYWDAFPLIFLVGLHSKGFYGLNLHYLSPRIRAVFFDKLIELSNNKLYNNKTKLQLTYNTLKGAAKLSLFKPCFKMYLFSQMGSKLVKIPAPEWEAALFLPTSNFKGASKSKIWSDSVLK